MQLLYCESFNLFLDDKKKKYIFHARSGKLLIVLSKRLFIHNTNFMKRKGRKHCS